MALSTECLLGTGGRGEMLSVSEALKLPAKERRGCICPVCRSRVIPHRRSKDGTQAAHFEHKEWNATCPRCMKRSA